MCGSGRCCYVLVVYMLTSTVVGTLWSTTASPEPHLAAATVGATAHHDHVELLSWVVLIDYDDRRHSSRTVDGFADGVAAAAGLMNAGQIGALRGYYQLDHRLHTEHLSSNILLTPSDHDHHRRARQLLPDHWDVKQLEEGEWLRTLREVTEQLEDHPRVRWYTQQHAFRRGKRAVHFDDPAFPSQWHLNNTKFRGQDLNIIRVWERNITGKGVVTAVVDDGLEWSNPDISPNYVAEASYDLNNNDRDPAPSSTDKKNHHGTRCAGEIAAAANSVCGVGVAYKAGIAGLKVLDGPMTDSLEGVAFTKGKDLIDVYSCSWGPDDDGKTVDGPHFIALRALKEAVDYGRQGYGSIFVVASGNGGTAGDNCNFDGYANSIFTVTIGAVDEVGAMPYYAEECASMLAVTFSSGSSPLRNIVTTDWRQAGGTGCTNQHTGTSAAAPLAAGMVALMLQARPCLTWRDVQHIIVMAAVKVDVDVAHWTRNKAGLYHSHKHGFGLMDAWRLVNAAKRWLPVPWMTVFSTSEMEENKAIPSGGKALTLTYTVDESLLDGYSLYTLEYVHVTVTIDHQRRGDLEIRLRCPSLTESILAAPRKLDKSGDGFEQWTFSTVRCWGEPPEGEWTLTVKDKGKKVRESRGTFLIWQINLYGSPMSEEDVAKRMQLVAEASSGSHLFDNVTVPCRPPPLRNKPIFVISRKNLKILVLTSAFCFVMALYEMFEYAFCYDEEKKKHVEEMRALAEQRRRGSSAAADGASAGAGESPADLDRPAGSGEGEEARLLETPEGLPLQTLSNGSGTHAPEDGQDPEASRKDSSGSRPGGGGTQRLGVWQKMRALLGGGRRWNGYSSLPESDLFTEDCSDHALDEVTSMGELSGCSNRPTHHPANTNPAQQPSGPDVPVSDLRPPATSQQVNMSWTLSERDLTSQDSTSDSAPGQLLPLISTARQGDKAAAQ